MHLPLAGLRVCKEVQRLIQRPVFTLRSWTSPHSFRQRPVAGFRDCEGVHIFFTLFLCRRLDLDLGLRLDTDLDLRLDADLDLDLGLWLDTDFELDLRLDADLDADLDLGLGLDADLDLDLGLWQPTVLELRTLAANGHTGCFSGL